MQENNSCYTANAHCDCVRKTGGAPLDTGRTRERGKVRCGQGGENTNDSFFCFEIVNGVFFYFGVLLFDWIVRDY